MKSAKEIVQELTLEEKAALCTGADFWRLHGVERLGILDSCRLDFRMGGILLCEHAG